MNGEIDSKSHLRYSEPGIETADTSFDLQFRDELVPFEDDQHANDHYALIYESQAEQLAVAVPFIREGINEGEQCIYVVDDRTNERETVIEALEAGGVDVETARAVGTLSFYSLQETYLRKDPFDPEEMVSFYADVIDAVDDAYNGLRVTAATNWIEDIEVKAFMEYEGRVNKLFNETNAKALCQYDRQALSPEIIRDVLRTHPHLIFEDTICRNVYYIPPDELFGPDQPEREVDRMMATLKERTNAKMALEASHARLEEFASAVTHDLKTPLATVASYLQLLERRYQDELDEDAAQFIEFAVNGATRMREMIDGIVTTYGQVGIEGESLEPVDLEALLDEVRMDLSTRIAETDARITATALPAVRGQRGQLRQVFLNLIDNGLKYAGDEPPRVHISAEPVEDRWIISVRDEGIGIEPDAVDSVFDVFSRGHPGDVYPGTGIGLALCERIVERHGGDIWVDSEPGVGSTFSFTLPTNRQTEN